ncbi:hypothetical protein [Branchiibius sp. NY16-3462-2]|uniref:hypothetical protein n=1 Tax=Branchiibius sp. NY16-3462-2 TaxID=1807500 RepID=UPI0025C298E7|nr:hypothetical protein [Branchiibius sp. NY16-3462-2]
MSRELGMGQLLEKGGDDARDSLGPTIRQNGDDNTFTHGGIVVRGGWSIGHGVTLLLDGAATGQFSPWSVASRFDGRDQRPRREYHEKYLAAQPRLA